jgi:hypothetical protein
MPTFCTEYSLLSATTAKKLSKLVSERLAEGWEPHGSPFARGKDFYQAVILKKEAGKRLRKTSGDG